ncbi:MAG: hypothetical protein FJX67_00080 [Alphaproteobacteria bacterium]|nr:hypothetical protein [Alphaproteobacteria bacterium]
MTRWAIVAGVVLAVAATPAAAQQWEVVGEDSDGKIYLDTPGVRIAGDVKTAWTRIVYREPKAVGDKKAEARQLLAHFDCKAGTAAALREIVYGDEKKREVLTTRLEATVSFNKATADAIGPVVTTYVCDIVK